MRCELELALVEVGKAGSVRGSRRTFGLELARARLEARRLLVERRGA